MADTCGFGGCVETGRSGRRTGRLRVHPGSPSFGVVCIKSLSFGPCRKRSQKTNPGVLFSNPILGDGSGARYTLKQDSAFGDWQDEGYREVGHTGYRD